VIAYLNILQVEIQLEIEELDEADEQKDDQLAEIFDLDPFDTVATTQEDSSDDESDESTEPGDFDDFSDVSSEANDLNEDAPRKVDEHVNYPHIRDMVEKLDAVMGIMFEYFESAQITKTAPGRPGSPSIVLEQETHTLTDGDVHTHKTIQFFNLLAVFNNLILKTLRSRYTQFLLFWYTSQDAQYLDVFQGMLISKAFLEQENPVVLRISAISYIASFVSRAQFVDRGHTRHIVRLFRQHLEDQLECVASEGSSRPNSSQYPTFYAVSQALFLIFCFRWRDLLDESECIEDMAALGGAALGARKWQSDLQVLPKIVNSVLNPLKVSSVYYVSRLES
jgi:RNA polymerase I-specific transcription initiation factor RRN3